MNTPYKTQEIFITCANGLEPLLIEELKEFGYTATAGFRGVYVKTTSLEPIYKINYCSRLASRVLLPLIHFKCRGRQDLYDFANQIDWTLYIPAEKTFAIDANVNHKLLKNSLFATQVVKDVICDQFREKTGQRPSVDVKNPDIQLNLFIHKEKAIISFDTSGIPLHKRGYRQEAVEAPVQEALAAAMLRLANYTGKERLLDPCCGSGTFLIEAALIATKTPPGYLRKTWGFKYLPEFSEENWQSIKAVADKERIPLEKGLISGIDINKNAIDATRANLRAAGFNHLIDIVCTDFRTLTPAVLPNLVIANPPHGIRLDETKRLIPLYQALGDFLKHNVEKPGKGFVFTANTELAKRVGLATKRRHILHNGGIESRLLEYDLY